jgi:predicted DsbA family dithiol-disulfide isomerase
VAETGVELVLVPFELRPSVPATGLAISAREAGGHSDRVEEHLARIAQREGIPFVSPAFVPNTHMALALGEFARDRGSDVHQLAHAAVFGAYFGSGLDIGRRDVLLDVAREVGFEAREVETAWDEQRYDERLHQFRHLALGIGLESTPAALICNELLIGSRPYEVLKQAVDACLLNAANVEAGAGDEAAPEHDHDHDTPPST